MPYKNKIEKGRERQRSNLKRVFPGQKLISYRTSTCLYAINFEMLLTTRTVYAKQFLRLYSVTVRKLIWCISFCVHHQQKKSRNSLQQKYQLNNFSCRLFSVVKPVKPTADCNHSISWNNMEFSLFLFR